MTEKDCEMLFCAFRYCLGRRSYVVSSFCSYTKEKLPEIHEKWLKLMIKEITEAQRHDDHPDSYDTFKSLGDSCNRQHWLLLRDAIQKELAERSFDGVHRK